MFTGLIEDVGRVRRRVRHGGDERIELESTLELTGTKLGDSIAVNGTCLTVVALGEGWFAADASTETLMRTTLGRLVAGERVHLERALRAGDRLGGHIVQGHVDGVGEVLSNRPEGRSRAIELRIPENLRAEVVRKGSIAVDGVSLTVNELTGAGCRLMIVPHTGEKTLLAGYEPGRPVNVETDVLAKYVAHMLGGGRERPSAETSRLSELLRAGGWMGGES